MTKHNAYIVVGNKATAPDGSKQPLLAEPAQADEHFWRQEYLAGSMTINEARSAGLSESDRSAIRGHTRPHLIEGHTEEDFIDEIKRLSEILNTRKKNTDE